MARRCLQCGHAWGWKLTDGRFKCRRCGTKYSWKSVWDTGKLQDRTKHQLLEMFIAGFPSSSSSMPSPVSLPTRERFFRVTRAVLSYHEYSKAPRPQYLESIDYGKLRFEPTRQTREFLVLTISRQNRQFQVIPAPTLLTREEISKMQIPLKQGALLFQANGNAISFLKVRRDFVTVPKEKTTPKSFPEVQGIEDFWNFAKHSLATHRGILTKFLPLYLGEIAFRFNHCHEDLFQVIHQLLQKTSMSEIRPFLAEKP